MICNLCGHTCEINSSDHGLIQAKVSGGYNSTPGNGFGALDDCTTYQFSFCEFCLDFLFQNSVVKPNVCDSNNCTPSEFVRATTRVMNDEWRKMKKEFFDESSKRMKSRRLKGKLII